jgi:hypothetical protein
MHFIWSEITPESVRWEQSFSLDDERCETNWFMESCGRTDEHEHTPTAK